MTPRREDAERARAAPEQREGIRALKRRGLIAGAAALVAGIAAKQTSAPVRAQTVDTNFVATGVGSPTIGFDAGASGFTTGVYGTGSSTGVTGTSTSGDGVFGNSTGGNGVIGTSTNSTGVSGTSTNSTGVFGTSTNTGTGVVGTSAGGIGVSGVSSNNGTGVKGQSTGGPGVSGTSTNGTGVVGTSTGGDGMTGATTNGTGVSGASTNGTGVFGQSTGNNMSKAVYGHHTANGFGVFGDAVGGTGVSGTSTNGTGVVGTSTNFTGVSGTSTNDTGMFGQSSGNSVTKAVYGHHTASGYEVFGDALGADGFGVTGIATAAFGVLGQSNSGTAVQGQILSFLSGGGANTAANTVAVTGINQSTGTGGIGVLGRSDVATGTGVKGISGVGFPIIGAVTGTGSATNVNAGVLGTGTAGPGVQGQSTAGHGLVGTTFATDGAHAALIGSVQVGGNAIGLRGSVPPGATGLAGMFDGDVTISGALRVFGSPKNAAVKHPGDGTYRLLYCMESPESWFEDFGTGTLSGDKAEIKLDPDFAVLVHTDTYHVFLTAHGPQQLYVPQQSPTGFTVMAIGAALAGGPKAAEGGGTFSWRVVAKRKDIAGERLAKVAPPPPLKSVTAFTVPVTPEAKTLAKKP